MRRTVPTVLALIALAPALAAFGDDSGSTAGSGPTSPTASASQVASADLAPGDPVPAPTGKVVLTLTGVPQHNVGKTLQFDLATLDRLGTVHYKVFDKQATGKTVDFSGPLVSTVLAVAGATDARQMHTLALNDYAVTVPVADTKKFPVVLATRADGRRMSVQNYGPTRFVYPDDPSMDPAIYDPRWVWQLKTIRVTG